MKLSNCMIKLLLSFYLIHICSVVTSIQQSKKDDIEPIINIYMEEPERNPVEVKRLEDDRRVERTRIRESEFLQETDYNNFKKLESLQDELLEKAKIIEETATDLFHKSAELPHKMNPTDWKMMQRNLPSNENLK